MTIKVNNTDIRTTYGAYLTGVSGLCSLLQWASSKSVSITSWQEKDGEDPDLENLKLSSRNISIPLAIKGENSQISALYNFIGANPYATWEFSELKLKMNLRLVGMSSLDSAYSLHLLTLTLSHDQPWAFYIDNTLYARTAPIGTTSFTSEYSIDNTALRDYYVRTLKGSANSILSKGGIKALLSRDLSTEDGIIYDGQTGVQPSNKQSGKTVSLNCLLHYPGVKQGLHNYYALLSDLVKKDTTKADITRYCARTLGYSGTTHDSYYRGQTVSDVAIGGDGSLWILFTIQLYLF